MKVRLYTKQTVDDYANTEPESAVCCKSWLKIIKTAEWKKPQDILKSFGDADTLGKGSERVVFNLCGNNFRMICKYTFAHNRCLLFVKWIGRHREYDNLCKKGLQYTVDDY